MIPPTWLDAPPDAESERRQDAEGERTERARDCDGILPVRLERITCDLCTCTFPRGEMFRLIAPGGLETWACEGCAKGDAA